MPSSRFANLTEDQADDIVDETIDVLNTVLGYAFWTGQGVTRRRRRSAIHVHVWTEIIEHLQWQRLPTISALHDVAEWVCAHLDRRRLTPEQQRVRDAAQRLLRATDPTLYQ